jgi:hypothetical protein
VVADCARTCRCVGVNVEAEVTGCAEKLVELEIRVERVKREPQE